MVHRTMSRKPDDRVGALAALYQAEKADASGMFNASMALMGVGAAYIVGAIGYLSKQEAHTLPAPLVALAPAPLWLIAAFQSLITLAGMMHTILIEIIEHNLILASSLDEKELAHVGSRGAAEIMDIRRSHWIHTVTTLLVYGGVFLMVAGFTAYSLNRVWPYLAQPYRVTFILAYAVALFVVLLCWVVGLGKVRQADQTAQVAAGQAAEKRAPRRADPEAAGDLG